MGTNDLEKDVTVKAVAFIEQIESMGYQPNNAVFTKTDISIVDKLNYKRRLYELQKAVNKFKKSG